MPNVTVDQRAWLTADKKMVVRDGDPRAAFLYAVPGDVVDSAAAELVGYPPKRPAPDEPKAETPAKPTRKRTGKPKPKD